MTSPAGTTRRFVAFLRGINVGGHRVKMDQLKAHFLELGLEDVSTFIASGNVVFSTDNPDEDGLTEAIEAHLARSLGYEVATFLRSLDELAAIAAVEGPGEDPEWSHYVILLGAPPPKAVRSALEALQTEGDRFTFAGREVHWHIRGNLSESALFGPQIERATRGVPNTSRNVNTLRRIVAKFAG